MISLTKRSGRDLTAEAVLYSVVVWPLGEGKVVNNVHERHLDVGLLTEKVLYHVGT